MKPIQLLIILGSFLIIACTSSKQIAQKPHIITSAFAKKQALTQKEKQNWYFKDIFEDSILGVSLEKAYKKLLKNKKSDTIIVALIDTELDIDHEDLKDQIWTNKDEIPNNNIDDDNNGYIDDIQGWNYANTKIGDAIPNSSYSYTRIIKKYDSLFKRMPLSSIPSNQKKWFHEYLRALKRYDKEKKTRQKNIDKYNRINRNFIKADSVLANYFPRKNYTIAQLDSLKATTMDSILISEISNMKSFLKGRVSKKRTDRYLNREFNVLNTLLNLSYNDRQIQGDNIHDILDIDYGNNNIQGTKKIHHGTQVMSILAASRKNNIGIDGISNLIRIMPVSISVSGDEFDKDIALAIRYAVDNGAKIINMSIGKEFSMHPNWLKEAIQYAESKDVLIVSSAGNKSYDLSKEFDYPDDYDENGEFAKNFIKVGASSYKADSTMVWLSSNYSQKNVDIFAPGHKIYCQTRKRSSYYSGTSYASPIVAGIAALIRSHYPNLSAIEVKEIILASGISFDVDVVQPYPYGEKQPSEKIPFSSLSKSGKIVNAYNALLMAEEVSKKKKRKK
ncbi:S8 family serine peptidase [uncultured Kordia sp.]|uniref:S8 family serine peptidase n=1 Tax=uncultured Kordia sp. TaxID=507699 RepID=UPI00261CA5A2|nr:S8 family serine peptidase [uncultured Kordia sp.]